MRVCVLGGEGVDGVPSRDREEQSVVYGLDEADGGEDNGSENGRELHVE
jgi:hypothetical protein